MAPAPNSCPAGNPLASDPSDPCKLRAEFSAHSSSVLKSSVLGSLLPCDLHLPLPSPPPKTSPRTPP
ncbi:hypothetical protein DUNSADRAFT_13948 [Dunaliella salina]|uniref:Encoded protein n=1 Tax=Dunaliella salina TaxID=3046 RepID=A0ABQ7G8B5_DUNSA|nr:hypothetical protein DUNSADRAFT_13948 [Dunaliella salina]|eukprot:KAF5830848.1 hypothetical protein DUNSADRAFT_13948 [Dunaliella salina]